MARVEGPQTIIPSSEMAGEQKKDPKKQESLRGSDGSGKNSRASIEAVLRPWPSPRALAANKSPPWECEWTAEDLAPWLGPSHHRVTRSGAGRRGWGMRVSRWHRYDALAATRSWDPVGIPRASRGEAVRTRDRSKLSHRTARLDLAS